MRYLMILLFLLTGCGSSSSSKMDPEIEFYYKEFLGLRAQATGIDMQYQIYDNLIKLQTLPSGEVGVCDTNLGGWEIKLDSQAWKDYSDIRRRALVYHELTHCTFNNHKHSADRHSYMNAFSPNNGSMDNMSVDDLNNQVINYIHNL